jgi:hypothetical protein
MTRRLAGLLEARAAVLPVAGWAAGGTSGGAASGLTSLGELEGAHPAVKAAEAGLRLLVLKAVEGVLGNSHQVAVAVDVAVPTGAGHLRGSGR